MKKLITYILAIGLLLAPANVLALTETPTSGTQNSTTLLQQDIDNDPVVSAADVDLTRGTTYGVLDGVTQTAIRGWAWNSGTPNTAINVHIYIKKDGVTQLLKSVTAGNYRPDLYNAGYGNGYHGFNYAINWKTYTPGQYQVYAYGINGSTNPMLASSPRSFTVRAATGVVDSITYNGISGWAWKPDAPNAAINAHIYIRRANGEQVALYAPIASNYRADLYNAGYGNGNHGFYRAIDWESLPREILTVQVYAVDGSGYHPCIYNQTFDNRKSIYLFAETDYDGYERIHWLSSTVRQYCENIGTSEVNVYSHFADYHIIDAIYKSRFFLIHTHGNSNSVEYNIYNSEPHYLYSSDFNDYSDTYFSNTNCVTVMACSTASGGASNNNNLVNTLKNKGVQTVVGFKDEITSFYINFKIVDTEGSGLWGKTYIYYLSKGYSVEQAVILSKNAVKKGNNYYGFDTYYIAGNANQVIKH